MIHVGRLTFRSNESNFAGQLETEFRRTLIAGCFIIFSINAKLEIVFLFYSDVTEYVPWGETISR